ncbi:MAG: PilZ domain-containing protein [Solirubrobacteraceae bacterium]
MRRRTTAQAAQAAPHPAASVGSRPHPSAQRREDFRVDAAIAVYVAFPGEPMVKCAGVDYSGSGLRAIVPELEVAEGMEMDVYMRMRNGVEVEARAVVVRGDEGGVSAFRFVELDSYQRESVIREVFAEQRRRLARARRTR